MNKWKVYVSQGPYTDLHKRVCAKLDEVLKGRQCDPVTVGQNAYGIKSTIEQVRNHMGTCSGAVVIAFRRFRLKVASEKPDSPAEKSISGRYLATVWNQLEAAIAYGRELPLLVIVEQDLHQEGMLSEKTGIKVIVADLDMKFLSSEEFQKTLDDWIEHVKERSKRSVVNPEAIRPWDIFRTLTVKHWWGIGGAIVVILSAIATAAFKLGTMVTPH